MKRTRLKPMSSKKKAQAEEYRILKRDYMKYHPDCEVEKCSNKAEDIHHKEGRGSKTNDTATWMAVCRRCHERIHAGANEGYGPSWAREKGYLV